jgi:arginyl-tRNA--protein-N-Asp/Glu arginylyltransferase
MKHTYRVEMHRAMFTEESFEIYKKYQASIHKENEEKDKAGYGRFLCWSPLYDSNDESVKHNH